MTIDEDAGSYTVQLRRTGLITADAMVPYTVSGGDSSPASEADFDGNAFPSGSFTFSGYDALSDEVSIMIENDGASEFTETFKISVTGGTSTPKKVAIIDDDPPGMPQPVPPVVVGFDSATYSVNEASGTVELTVEVIDGVLTETVMLTYTTTDASATSPDDYTGGAFSLTLPAMARSVAFTIPIVDDSDVEGDELFTVALSSTLPGVLFNPISATVTIINNDTPAVTAMLSTAGLKVEEGQDASFMIRLSEMAAEDLEFRLTRIEEGSTATEGEDYSLPALPIVVPAGERGVSVTISTLSDVAHEVDKTVRFALTPVSGTNVNLGTPSEILLEIEELFDAVLTFQTPSVEVSDEDLDTSVITEAGTYSETLRVVLRDASPMREVLQELPAEYQHLEVSSLADIYFVDDGGDTVSDLDREVTVMISVPMSEVDSLGGPDLISFAVLHDGASEWELLATTYRVVDSEYVFETASDRFSLFGLVLRADPQPELEVVTATVSFSATSWYEGDDDALVVTIELADGMVAQSDLTIDYELEFPTIDTDGNRRMAADAADFVGATSGSVLIEAGESSSNLEIASRPSDGYRYLGFNARGGRGPFVNVAFRQAVATLIDTEQIAREVLQGVVSPIYSVVPESNGFWHNPDLPRFGSGSDREARVNEAVRILAAGGYTWTVAPSWDAINGRVIAGEGFTDSDGQEVRKFEIVYVHGEQSFDPFRFAAANLIEEWLNEVGIPTEVTTSSIDTTFISTIRSEVDDYDAWILGWNPTPYPRSHLVNTFTTGAFYNLGRWSNTEYDRLAADFPRNEPTDAMELARVRELAFQMQAILAHELPYVVLFPTPPATENLALADDSVSEEPELFTIRLTGASAVSGATLRVADEPAIITILDNDAVEYVIEGAETVAEEDGVYVARLRRSGYTLPDASVAYTVIGLEPNAADQNDFSGAQLPSGAVTFVGHDTLSTEIRIPLMDDAVSEGLETFQIVVARGVSTLTAIRDVTLWDADVSRPVISLDPITDITEGENLKITARLSSIASDDVMLSLTVSSTLLSDAYPDSADDYTLLSPQIIRAGDLTTTFILKTLDDAIYEGTEFGKLVLTIISPSTGVDAGNVERTFRLIDNDPVPVVSLDPVDARITEVENLTVTVRLSNPTNVDVTLALAVFGDVDRGDYELAPPTVTIPAGQSVATFNLNTVDYVISEEDELVELSLILISPEIGIGLGEVNRTFTLVDNDQVPIISLDPVDARLDEGQSLMVTARLSRVVDFDTTLSLSVAGDVDQDDYTLSMPTVTIPKGQLVATFTLDTTLDTDADAEADELVELSLGIVSPATGVGIGVGGAVRTFTLVDSGPAPTASLDPVSPRVKEGEALAITVNLSIPAKVDTTLALVVAGDVDQDDYTLSAPTVTIRAGQSVATFNLNTIPDTVYEGDEQVELSLIVSPAGSARVGGETRTFILEENGPVPTVSLDSVRPEITEGDNAALVITFKLPDGVTAANDITVDYELEFPTMDAAGNQRMAADATDFVGATTGTVLIEAGKSGADLEIANGPPGGYRYLGFNTQREQFNDVAFRQAVATLIDTDFIAQSVLGGVVSPIYSVVSESNGFWHNPDVPKFGSGLDREARINEAVRILKEGGYTWTKEPSWDQTNSRVIAGEGFGDSAGSFTTTFEIVSVTESDDPFRFAAANLIEEWLDEAGIPTTVTTADLFAISDMIPSFDAWILGWDINTLYPESPLRVTFADGERLNYGSWVNAEYERLIAQLPTDEPTDAMDLARARELVFQLQAILARELPYVLLFPNPPATEDLALVDDKVSEEPELVGIRLTGARVVSGPTLMVADEPAIITILDNDAVKYVIEGAATVAEDDDVYTARLRRSGHTLSDARVDYTVIGLGPNAADHNDFSGAQLPSGTVTFVGHDALSTEIRIPLMDDADLEGPETFRIVVARGVSTLTATRDVTLSDNDATLSLSGPSTVSENDATVMFTARLDGNLEANLEVELVVVGGDAAASDYTLSPARTTIQAGQREVQFTLQAHNNQIAYGDKTVKLELRRVSGPVVILGVVDLMLTITEDDVLPQLSLQEIVPMSIREGMIVTVTATLDMASVRTIIAELTPSHTDADLADYTTPTTLRATIQPGATFATFTIIATADGIYEGTAETLEFTLSVVGGGAEVAEPRSRQLSILDIDPVPSISFVEARSRIAENAANSRHDIGLRLSGALKDDITVSFTTAGSATRGADYTLIPTTVTIRGGTRDAIIRLDINDDELYEGPDSEIIILRLESATGGVTVDMDNDEHTVTITGDDQRTISLDPVAPILEGDTVTVTARLSHALGFPLLVTLMPVAGTSAKDQTDYKISTPTMTIPAGSLIATFEIQAIADALYEETEMFELEFLVTPDMMGAIVSVPRVVTIVDNDQRPTISLDPVASILEGDTVMVTARLSDELGFPLLVTLMTAAKSAEYLADYEIPTPTKTIPSGSLTAEFEIQVTYDGIDEGPETFELGLWVPPDTVELSVNASRAVTIIDRGPVTATLSLENITVPEGNNETFEIRLSSSALEDLTFRLVGGPSGEYRLSPDPIVISDGDDRVTVTITAVDDTDLEPAEVFTLRLESDSSRVNIGDPGSITVTIPQNDSPEVTLSIKNELKSMIPELDDPTMLFTPGNTIELMVEGVLETLEIGLAARAATVDDGGTAADVAFYKRIRGVEERTIVTLSPGQTNQDIWVASVADDVVEFNETVNLYIATVNGIRITDSGVDITIEQNDEVQEATLTVEDGAEGGTTMATIDLKGKTLSSAIPSDALRLVLADGSTADADDVEIVATDIVAALQKASTVNVPIILKDDGLEEVAERVDLELVIDSTIAAWARQISW